MYFMLYKQKQALSAILNNRNIYKNFIYTVHKVNP